MNIRNHIPNLLTLGNLFCGTLAAILAVRGDFEGAAILVALGILFDFLDGFVARLLHVQSELGKQLDSLADMVTSGVVPGIIMLQMIVDSIDKDAVGYFGIDPEGRTGSSLPYLGLLLTLAACYRLAKFNLDTRQSDSFIGLPTPAMTLFVVSLPLITMYSDHSFFVSIILNKYFLIAVILLLSILMNAELPLFSLKFKNFGFKENAIKYFFLAIALTLLITLHFVAIPLIILLYILLSVVQNASKKA